MARRAAGQTDYRDLRRKGERDSNRPRLPDQYPAQWWALEGEQCAGSISSAIQFLQKNQQGRMRQNVISARLYGNFGLTGASGATYARLLTAQSAIKDRMTYNAVQMIIDTLTSRVGETKPRPYFLTSGGNYRQQRKAKKLNQFVEGVFYENKTYDTGLKAFRDAAIWGDGFVFVFGRAGRICHERVLNSEIWVDEVEGQYGFPRNMHRVKVVDRDELASYFPEHRKAIMEASRANDTQSRVATNISDMVTVAESWHLGATNDEGEVVGGKHAITLVSDGSMLLEPEDYPHDFFPFARIPWCERPVGYWSQGLAEQLQGDQIELNRELAIIQRSMHLAGSYKVLIKNGSKVVTEALNNEIGAEIHYAGDTPPQYVVPQPIHEMYFSNPDRIVERMRQRAGMSELATSGKKPMGLNSGVALREFQDIESDRHRTTQRQNDNLYLQLAALSISVARDLSKEGGMEKVRVPGKLAFEELDWKRDIGNIKDDEFVMQCFPVSRLPRDPAGRLQTIQEYIQAGMISPRQGRKALDFADIDSIESLANAQEDLLTKILDTIVDEGEYEPPQPTDDLALAKEMVVEYIQRFRALDLEPERLELLRNWNSQVDMLVQLATPPPAPMGSVGGTPQAAPAPPPQSDLVQNVPGMSAAA